MSFKLLVYLEEVVLLLLAVSMYYSACLCVPTFLGIQFQCATSRRVIPERQWSPV
jgi:hypothetical protein